MASQIRSPVTGVVLDVSVAVGDTVDIGTGLAIAESMKVEIPIQSETTGKIRALHIQPGDHIGDGQVIAEVD